MPRCANDNNPASLSLNAASWQSAIVCRRTSDRSPTTKDSEREKRLKIGESASWLFWAAADRNRLFGRMRRSIVRLSPANLALNEIGLPFFRANQVCFLPDRKRVV